MACRFLSVLISVLLLTGIATLSARPHGAVTVAPTRVLIIGYGQSNMDTFFQVGSTSTPAALPGTSFYSCPGVTPPAVPTCTTTSVPGAIGLRILQNTIKTVTGLPSLSMVCAIGGSGLNGLTSGGPTAGTENGYQGCINQALANVLPTDQVFFLWDQGETDSAGTPELPDYYAPTVVQLHTNLAAAIGRTTATAPLIVASKGVVVCSGCISDTTWFQGNATKFSWHVLTNSLKAIPSYDLGARWFNQYDFTLGSDGLHYVGDHGQAFAGPRYARYITNFMGYTTGDPVFEIASASVIDATNTAVNVTHSLGTDYTPASSASGTNGFEVSGDNGATWNLASTTRTSATQIKLTHVSLPTTNARLVRHLYSMAPPDTDVNCGGSGALTCTGPSSMTFDNSSLAIPLSPTTYPVRAAGLTTQPMASWRDITVLLNGGSPVQSQSAIQLGPDHVRKYLVLSLVGATSVPTNITITPQDFFGNNVGSPVVVASPTKLAGIGKAFLYGVTLNSDNQNASTFSINVTFASGEGGVLVNVWTIPFADLNSTTPVGANASETPASTMGATTLNASVGACVIAAVFSSANLSTSTAYSLTGTDAGSHAIPMAIRWLSASGIATFSGDGEGVQSSGTASVTANLVDSGTIDLAVVAFR